MVQTVGTISPSDTNYLPPKPLTATASLNSNPDKFNIQNKPADVWQVQDSLVTTTKAPENIQTSIYDAAQATNVAPATAAQTTLSPDAVAEAAIGELPPEALVSSQMEELTKSLENNDETPLWARGAVDAVEAQLASRGLTRSSIGQSALTNAIVQAALPIAQGNAQSVNSNFQQNKANEQQVNVFNAQQGQQINLANLANRQSTTLANLQVRQQTMLSNQAATNASRQFNAASENQTRQFMTNLTTQVSMRNSDAKNTIAQFNAGQSNAAAQFNANLDFNTSKFNSQNATLIEQSNLEWRRNANTADTATSNQALLLGLQHQYGMETAEINQAWQEARDVASWVWQAGQNDNQIQSALVQASLSSQTSLDVAQLKSRSESYGAIGGAATNIVGSMFGDSLKGVGSALVTKVGGWLGF